MIQEAMKKVVDGTDLSEAEMKTAMDEVLEGRATPAQVGAFLTALPRPSMRHFRWSITAI